MSMERIVNALVATFPLFFDGPMPEDYPEQLIELIEKEDPKTMQMVRAVQVMVMGYLGAEDPGLDAAFRNLLTAVAAGGKAKHAEMTIDGQTWEALVRVKRIEGKGPRIILPFTPGTFKGLRP